MNKKKYIDLVNKEVDGIINEKERNQLHQYLEENPGAKNLYLEIIRTIKIAASYVNDSSVCASHGEYVIRICL